MVEIKTKQYKQAEKKENTGKFGQSSDLYVRSAFERLAKTRFGTDLRNSNTLLAVGDLLRGIYCAVRAENDKSAEPIQKITQGILELLRSRASNPCLKGILIEWIGDSYLLIKNPKCKEYYEDAEQIYKTIDDDEQRNWGMEPEIDHAHWIFEDFIDWYEVEASSTTDTPLQLDFLVRISFKKKIAKRILSDDALKE